MTTAVIAEANPDGLDEALEDGGATVVRVTGIAPADSLSEAGIEDTGLLVLADMGNATTIAVAKEQSPDVRVVTYTYDTLPELTKGRIDLTTGPNLLAADVVVEELI